MWSYSKERHLEVLENAYNNINIYKYKKKDFPEERINEIIQLRESGVSIKKIAKMYKISDTMVHRILKRNFKKTEY